MPDLTETELKGIGQALVDQPLKANVYLCCLADALDIMLYAEPNLTRDEVMARLDGYLEGLTAAEKSAVLIDVCLAMDRVRGLPLPAASP